ncbi:unnamed protein product [Closterium sp. Naga37s-1]|nr:unnamed protein product [Closterium sp. Naga37s-1]
MAIRRDVFYPPGGVPFKTGRAAARRGASSDERTTPPGYYFRAATGEGVTPLPHPNAPSLPSCPPCLYPSPPGYYFRAAPGEGVTSWHIHFPGGGWCATKSQCSWRTGRLLGGTTRWPPTNNASWAQGRFGGILSSNEGANPFFAGWHLAMAVYCDGGGYAGAAGRVAVGKRRFVHMDGSRIASAILHDLLENQALSRATEVLVSGTSAGGLAVMRLCDSLAALLPRATVKCLLDGSFFPGMHPAALLPSHDHLPPCFPHFLQPSSIHTSRAPVSPSFSYP